MKMLLRSTGVLLAAIKISSGIVVVNPTLLMVQIRTLSDFRKWFEYL